MKRKKIGMLKQIILVSLVLQAIYANTFLGKVIDAKTGMPIIEANIQVNDSEHIGTITNKSGIFSLSVTNLKNINIKITAIGYKTAENSFEIENSDMATIRLNRSAVELSPIDVLADRSRLSGTGHNYYRVPGSLSLISKAEVLEFNDTDINRVFHRFLEFTRRKKMVMVFGPILVCEAVDWNDLLKLILWKMGF